MRLLTLRDRVRHTRHAPEGPDRNRPARGPTQPGLRGVLSGLWRRLAGRERDHRLALRALSHSHHRVLPRDDTRVGAFLCACGAHGA